MPKLTIVPVLYIYMFCYILCFSIEDFFITRLLSEFSFFKDYWSCFSFMIVSSFAILIYEIITRKKNPDKKDNKFALNFFITIVSLVVILNISFIIYGFFKGAKINLPKILMIFTNIFAIISYLLWIKLINSNLKQKNFKKYISIILVSIVSTLSISYYLSNKFSPRDLWPILKEDESVYKSVKSISSALINAKTVYNNTDELIKNIKEIDRSQVLNNKIEYKKINDSEFQLSWTFKTSEIRFKRRRNKRRVGDYLEFIDINNYKPGINTKTYKIKEKIK